ncbi:MAG: N-sulfoglucosamine sulfohydrolase [Verrucomicrobiales bacterium]|jgi:N-sulfoglucosamine sulfohydrolase
MKIHLTVTLLLTAAFAISSPAAKRNIVLFVTDDQSPDTGAYGNTAINTPHLDALASDGTLFTHAFATTASCSASRSVILSGLHNHANGQYGHQHAFHKFSSWENLQTLPVLLTRHGYRTAQIGKYHVAPEQVYRFETYLKGNARNAPQMANQCKEFINATDERPFFLYFATSDPHRGGGVDKTSQMKHKPDLFGNKSKKGSHDGVDEVFYDPKDVIVPKFLPDTPTSREEIAQYYQSISRIDQGVGRLVQLLKEAGKYEETLIVFTSDHGMAFPGGKTTVYEGGLKVPFIVHHPDVEQRGIKSDAMISHIDITPSLLDFAGAWNPAKQSPLASLIKPVEKTKDNQGRVPNKLHGRSWVPALGQPHIDGWNNIGASHTFHEIQMYYPMRAVRDREYKLIWNIAHPLPYPFASDLWAAATWQTQWDKGKDAPYGTKTVGEYIQRPQFEFYDIKNDPDEAHNLADETSHAETLETYKSKLKAFQKATGDPWITKWDYE